MHSILYIFITVHNSLGDISFSHIPETQNDKKTGKKGNGKNGAGGKATQKNSSPKKRKTASFFHNTSSLQQESPTPGTSRDIMPDLPNLPQVNEER